MLTAILGTVRDAIALAREAVAARREHRDLRARLEASEAARIAAERHAADERRAREILTHYSAVDRRGQ